MSNTLPYTTTYNIEGLTNGNTTIEFTSSETTNYLSKKKTIDIVSSVEGSIESDYKEYMGYKLYKYDKFVNRELSTIEIEESWATDGYIPYVEYTSTWGGTATIVYEFTDSNISNIEDDFILFAGGRLISYAGAQDSGKTYGSFYRYFYPSYDDGDFTFSLPDTFKVLYRISRYDDRLVERDEVLEIWNSTKQYEAYIEGIYYLMDMNFIVDLINNINREPIICIVTNQTTDED